MTVDEAIRDLLSISSDIRGIAVLDAQGEVLAAHPGAASGDLAAAAGRLWELAAARAAAHSGAPLEHIIVHDSTGSVAVLEAYGRRIIASTGAQPAVGLLVFDLRTCLSDAFAVEEGTP